MKRLLTLFLAVVLVFTLFAGCNKKDPAPAATPPSKGVMNIGNYEVSAKEYEYNFCSQLWNFYSTYYDYIPYMGLDLTTSLKGQQSSAGDGKTWAEVFMASAEEMLTQVYCFYNAALAEKMELNETYVKQIDAYVLSYKEDAQATGMTLDEFLAYNFGAGMTETDLRTYLSHRFLAAQYCDVKLGSITYTDEQYEAYYQNHKSELDRVNFRVFTLTESHLTEKPDTNEAVAEAVKARAESFAKDLTNEEEFIRRAKEYATEEEKETFSSDSATLAQNIAAEKLAEGDMKTWLFDSARKAGDVAVHKTAETSYTVCYYLSGGRDERNLVSMRHLLLTVSDQAGQTDAEVSAKIQKLYDDWVASGATEESFAALATEYTEDPGSKESGGYYDFFPAGTMVSEIEDWLYAEGRKRGDHVIVKTSYGYHMVYFTGYGDLSWKSDCLIGLQDEDYMKLLADLQVKYTVSFAENYKDTVGNTTFKTLEE